MKSPKTEDNMGFKKELLAALEAGRGHQSLLETVNHFQAKGLTPEETYQLLEQNWLGFGFEKKEEESALQGNLEFVMEKVWYQGSSKIDCWHSSGVLGGEPEPKSEGN
jgi:hypothetical protein